jgi:2-succinyl-5-enolpyruvyl-6-hydroxy-3-cyclohexene-1-carboxylate synthase
VINRITMKQYSNKKSVQILSHCLLQYQIDQVVFSPGSRNAPLALHISEIDDFKTYSIVDERSAAFVGMGMAKALHKPVAVCCTSGSAAANYYPAVVEAFYQNVPLLLLTADRPADYVDLFDGQTIRQKDLFAQHSYGNFELLEDHEPNAAQRNLAICQAAIEACLRHSGPVHLNIPLSEPLYQMVAELPAFKPLEKSVINYPYELDAQLVSQFNQAKKTMIVLGTLDPPKASWRNCYNWSKTILVWWFQRPILTTFTRNSSTIPTAIFLISRRSSCKIWHQICSFALARMWFLNA